MQKTKKKLPFVFENIYNNFFKTFESQNKPAKQREIKKLNKKTFTFDIEKFKQKKKLINSRLNDRDIEKAFLH